MSFKRLLIGTLKYLLWTVGFLYAGLVAVIWLAGWLVEPYFAKLLDKCYEEMG